MDKPRKDEIRRAITEKRLGLCEDEVRSLSLRIEERMIASVHFSTGRLIMAYMPIHNEVMTDAIIKAAFDAGKVLCFPRVTSPSVMEAAPVLDIKHDLIISSMGIPEPMNGIPSVNPNDIDMIIVPGIAFDRSGHRIGFGRGYFDRFIPLLRSDCLRISPAYQFQVLENLPYDEGDQPVNIIVTENETITAGQSVVR